MNYKEAIDFLIHQFPAFQYIGPGAYKPDLDNVRTICQSLRNPQSNFRSIHVAGTNGKGSVSHMLSAILQSNGYRCGLFTSPHLVDFRERIRINGEMIEEAYVIDFVEKEAPKFIGLKPSFFELTTALAFKYFDEQRVDVAIIETGMGGRLDSTNIILPLFSIITNIGLDHQQFLGDTIQQIAVEKAGIIKHRTPVFVGRKQPETSEVFNSKSVDLSSPCFFAEDVVKIISTSEDHNSITASVNDEIYTIRLPLEGKYQFENLKTCLSTIPELKKQFNLNIENTIQGLNQFNLLTGLKGRWDILQENPTIICEAAHNEMGLESLANQTIGINDLHIIFGMVKDKDPLKHLALLPKDATYYFTQASGFRSLDHQVLLQIGLSIGLKCSSYPIIANATDKVLSIIDKDSTLIITGSIFVIADFYSFWQSQKGMS